MQHMPSDKSITFFYINPRETINLIFPTQPDSVIFYSFSHPENQGIWTGSQIQ